MSNEARGPDLLRAALVERGWSQGDLERAIEQRLGAKVGDGLVSKWVNGRRMPGLEYALVIEELLPSVPARSWVVALDTESPATEAVDRATPTGTEG